MNVIHCIGFDEHKKTISYDEALFKQMTDLYPHWASQPVVTDVRILWRLM